MQNQKNYLFKLFKDDLRAKIFDDFKFSNIGRNYAIIGRKRFITNYFYIGELFNGY